MLAAQAMDGSSMNQWLDALTRVGAPAALLALVLWKLWPLVVRFIDQAQEAVKRQGEALEAANRRQAEILELANRRVQESMTAQLNQAERLHEEFLQVLKKYNDSNDQMIKELSGLTASVERLGTVKRIRR